LIEERGKRQKDNFISTRAWVKKVVRMPKRGIGKPRARAEHIKRQEGLIPKRGSGIVHTKSRG
jgi:hypothetical protein